MKIRTDCLSLLLAMVLPLTAAAQTATPSAERSDPVLTNCRLSFLPENYIEISADKAGILRQLAVREGSRVEEDQVIAQIDDREAAMQLRIAEQRARAAYARATDEVEEKYARAAADAAGANYADLQAANSGPIDRVVSATELRSSELEWTRAKLQIEKALKDRELARFDYAVAKAEWEAAQMEIDRRVIKAPFSGQVVELFNKENEWVEPGEPILQFARYDVLQCDGKVYLEEYDPREIEDCEVTVEVRVGREEVERATGRITYVEQQVFREGDDYHAYRVVAEIPNRMDRGRWALFPGLPATMTVHLGTAMTNVSRSE